MHCLDWFHIPSWLLWTPGIYTLFVALIAGIIPTMGWYQHRSVKITYFVLLGLLCSLEIASIRNDRMNQDKKHESEMGIEQQRFDRVFQLMQGIQSGQSVQISAANTLNQLLMESQHVQKTSEERQLKIRALDLSRDIGQFTTQVRMQEVTLPTPATHGLARINDPAWVAWSAQLEAIEHNAVAQYHVQFGASVKDLVEQLKKKNGWDSKECDTSLDMPYNKRPQAQFLYLEGCAQDLQRAATKLP